MRIVRSTPGLVIGQAMLAWRRRSIGRQNDEVVVVVEDNGETTDDKRSPFDSTSTIPNVPWWSSSRAQTPDLRTESLESTLLGLPRCTRRQYSVLDPAPRCTSAVPTNLRSIAVGE